MGYWSDGIHYVKPADRRTRDAEKWPWRVGSHKHSASTYKRKVATLDDGIAAAKAATKLWLSKTPGEVTLLTEALLPAASSLPGKRKERAPVPKKVPPFSTYHFNCISANPIAQVWMCVTAPGELGAIGRRAKGGRANKQSAFNHTKGECAVMLWKEPVRNADGSVRVFTRSAAEHYAIDAFYGAPEDERIHWEEGNKVVHTTRYVDVLFDPDCNGVKTPFSLWVYPPGGDPKPVYEGYRKKKYAKAGKLVTGGTYMPSTPDEAAALAFNKKLAAIAAEDHVELSTREATFESIWSAEHHALTVTEPTLRGERVRL